MIVLPALSSVNDISDTDLILVEKSTGEGFKMTGADLKNFINAQATDTVALNNMHSVTSNAVAIVTSSKVDFLEGSDENIMTAFSQVSIPEDYFSRTAKSFCDNINSYNSGIHTLSIGGPAYGFVLFKINNDNFVIDIFSYTEYANNIIRVKKTNNRYNVYRFSK